MLKRPSDFQKYLGSPITVKLYRPRNGMKEIPCVLRAYEDGRLTVEAGKETVTFENPRSRWCGFAWNSDRRTE